MLGKQKMDNKLKMINKIEKLANYTVTALTNLFGQIAIGQPIWYSTFGSHVRSYLKTDAQKLFVKSNILKY